MENNLSIICKQKLIEKKQELLNRINDLKLRNQTRQRIMGGDEADQTLAILEEKEFLRDMDRSRTNLLEVESALARIEQGTFGVCEETEEPIEEARLIAIPWTRLSIEGAEIQDSMRKKYAR